MGAIDGEGEDERVNHLGREDCTKGSLALVAPAGGLSGSRSASFVVQFHLLRRRKAWVFSM
jgi:hypothetical protein